MAVDLVAAYAGQRGDLHGVQIERKQALNVPELYQGHF